MRETAPPELDRVLAHMIWRTTKLPGGRTLPDLGLDKKAVKTEFKRPALLACFAFLMNASDAWLVSDFKPRLDDAWRSAMGPDDETEKLRYLSQRVVADLMRATGIGP